MASQTLLAITLLTATSSTTKNTSLTLKKEKLKRKIPFCKFLDLHHQGSHLLTMDVTSVTKYLQVIRNCKMDINL